MESDRNWFTIEESHALAKIAISLGHSSFWQIGLDNKISCLICGEYISEHIIGQYQKLLVSHMLKHLKLKAFL